MAELNQATTPIHIFKLPMDTSECSKIEVAYKQGYRKIYITNDDDEMTLDEKNVIIKLTQEQSLRFEEGKAKVQIRVLSNDVVYKSRAFDVHVNESISKRIL
jgi:hypothetical protein